MSVYKYAEYKTSTKDAIRKYEKRFGKDTFPSYYFEYEKPTDTFENEIVKSVEECIKSNKNVYELNIVPLDVLQNCY